MAGRCDPTDELMTYLEARLEADGLDYREAVMIEDLMASLSKLQGSSSADAVDRSLGDADPFYSGIGVPNLGPKSTDPKRF